MSMLNRLLFIGINLYYYSSRSPRGEERRDEATLGNKTDRHQTCCARAYIVTGRLPGKNDNFDRQIDPSKKILLCVFETQGIKAWDCINQPFEGAGKDCYGLWGRWREQGRVVGGRGRGAVRGGKEEAVYQRDWNTLADQKSKNQNLCRAKTYNFHIPTLPTIFKLTWYDIILKDEKKFGQSEKDAFKRPQSVSQSIGAKEKNERLSWEEGFLRYVLHVALQYIKVSSIQYSSIAKT